METFLRLFGRLLSFVYHCFDRIVIHGYLPLLSRREHIVYFFHDVHGIRAIPKEVLHKRTDDYNRWVDSFARNHLIPPEWPKKASAVQAACRQADTSVQRLVDVLGAA